MKAIINGKRYDTETATEVAHYENSYYANDFHHYEEALYLTRAGNWFLAGHGGGLSKYARSVGSTGSCDGSAIIPMSTAEAREWLASRQRPPRQCPHHRSYRFTGRCLCLLPHTPHTQVSPKYLYRQRRSFRQRFRRRTGRALCLACRRYLTLCRWAGRARWWICTMRQWECAP